MDRMRYPTGHFDPKPNISDDERTALIGKIADTPAAIREAVRGLDDAQLDTPYRPGGWTVRQAGHHVADSSLNGYVRFRWALTEDNPTLKGYEERDWASLADASTHPLEASLVMLDGIHERLTSLLSQLDPEDYARPCVHPEVGTRSVDWLIQLYGWHGAHHAAHIQGLRDREGW